MFRENGVIIAAELTPFIPGVRTYHRGKYWGTPARDLQYIDLAVFGADCSVKHTYELRRVNSVISILTSYTETIFTSGHLMRLCGGGPKLKYLFIIPVIMYNRLHSAMYHSESPPECFAEYRFVLYSATHFAAAATAATVNSQ